MASEHPRYSSFIKSSLLFLTLNPVTLPLQQAATCLPRLT